MPKIGARNTAKNISDFVAFSWFLDIIMGLFGAFNHSQIAHFDSRTYCNTFCMISGTTKHVTKSGPSDPVFITKIFQKIQETYGNILENLIFISENLKVWKSWKVDVPNCSFFTLFCFFVWGGVDILKMWNVETLKMTFWLFESLEFPKLKSQRRASKNMKKSCIWISYLSKKHEMEIW